MYSYRPPLPTDENNPEEQNRRPFRVRSRRELILEFKSDVRKLLESYEEFAVVPNVDHQLDQQSRLMNMGWRKMKKNKWIAEEIAKSDGWIDRTCVDLECININPEVSSEESNSNARRNKPYCCKLCKIWFSNLQDLRSHKRTHNYGGPYRRN